jgi:RNA polymerase sigma factor (sigma-70 family)
MHGNEQEKISSPRSRLDEALDQLDDRVRRVMELWLAGRSHAEIADILGISERGARVLRAAAARQMRRSIAAMPPPHGSGGG